MPVGFYLETGHSICKPARSSNGWNGRIREVKWRKQMTAMWDDERVSRLVNVGGIEGLAAFGLYCRVLDIVASQMDSRSTHCSVTYSVTRWSLLLSVRGSHVRQWLKKMVVTGLLTAEWTDTEITVTIHKLLKYRDEYSRKSRESPDQRTEQNRTDREQIQNQIEPRQIPARVVVTALRKPTTEPPGQFIISMEELEAAWERHLKHSKEEPRDLTFQVIFSMNGQFDPAKFRARHGPYCEAWSGRWQFCPLTFLAWVRAGMPQADMPKTDRQRQEDDIWREK